MAYLELVFFCQGLDSMIVDFGCNFEGLQEKLSLVKLSLQRGQLCMASCDVTLSLRVWEVQSCAPHKAQSRSSVAVKALGMLFIAKGIRSQVKMEEGVSCLVEQGVSHARRLCCLEGKWISAFISKDAIV
eukprot:1158109-Pelagomonas_calceolata.AAC.10